MRTFLLAVLISLASAPAWAQTETHSGDFIVTLAGKGPMFVQGFRSFFAGEYVAPESNLAALRAIKDGMPKMRIVDFGADDPTMTTLVCRMSWPVYAPAKLPYTLFIAGAMRDELTREGLYSSDDGIALTGRLNAINFESFGTGKWKIEGAFSVDGKAPVVVTHETTFPVALGAASACRSVRDNLVPAVQAFLFAVYADPRFQALVH
jgi:hypothetical protein